MGILKGLAKQGLVIGISSQDMGFIRKVFNEVYYIEQGTIIEFCNDPQKLPAAMGIFIK